MWKYLEENHLFAHTYEEQSLDEIRELTVRRIYDIFEKEFVVFADVRTIYESNWMNIQEKQLNSFKFSIF